MDFDKFMVIKKFTFSVFAFTLGTATCIYLKYPGETYVQIVGIIATGFLVAQAYVDAKKTTPPAGG